MTKTVGSIRDVARESGLSIATVSRVMNGGTNVSADTRRRVLDACERVDYVPNSAARTLSTRRSRTIAAIIPTIEHSVFAKYIAAIEAALGAEDYALVLAISNNDPVEERAAARKLLGMGADAFILSGADHDPDLIDLFARRQVPFVFTSIWDPTLDHATIGYDNFALAATAVRYLADHDHRRIAVVHGPLSENDRMVARKAGAASAARGQVSLAFHEAEVGVAGGRSVTEAILADPDPATAILCFSDVLALGVYFGLAAAGKSVPKDMSVMGFDNLDWSSETEPALTTLDLPAARMGTEVAHQIVAHLKHGHPLTERLLDSKIVERASVTRAPDAGA